MENYPGFPEGISGKELTQKFKEQAERFGLQIVRKEVSKIEKVGKEIVAHLELERF